MSEILEKLRPDRDLQCYFFRPSAIAALSASSPTGFTLSGTWRQQFDWAVVEWNRDNVFEHPQFRNLPDGDLSGLTLTYDETRSNCIPIDSDLYPTVDWPSLRIWASDGANEQIYYVNLRDYAIPIEGDYQPASAVIELGGTATVGDYVGVAFLDEHYSYVMTANPIWFAAQNLVDGVNAFSPAMTASRNGNQIALTLLGTTPSGGSRVSLSDSRTGANGNRAGLYTYTYSPAAPTETWDTSWKQFSGGSAPTKWRITLPFGSLLDVSGKPIPMRSVRKLRWTYAAELQGGAFERSEFQAVVSNWVVTGAGRTYSVSGCGSQRINDDASTVVYSGQWAGTKGNFSSGTIHQTNTPGASLQVNYSAAQSHSLYLGTRFASNGASVQVVLDGGSPFTLKLALPLEDVLIRSPLGELGPGSHTVRATHAGQLGTCFYFDFLEVSAPTTVLPVNRVEPDLTLATDWDTDHSIALAPERTAWFLQSLGFKGRVNHYAGALWFYELTRTGHQYASGSLTFSGSPDANLYTRVSIGRTDQPAAKNVVIAHQNLVGDTAATLAKAFELKINNGYTAIWAHAVGSQLTIFSRSMGVDGNAVTIDVTPSTAHLTTARSGATLTGGVDGDWRTDLASMPRVNRAARDWTRSFCNAVKSGSGADVTVAFSMELQHGDPSLAAGIAQRYPSGLAAILDTPALQTNFSPASQSFWKQVYLDMAQVQMDAGLRPYLQFGEVQWWYNMDGDHSGMPFYDAYTVDTFRSLYGRNMAVITSHDVDPATVLAESAFLPTLIGAFTNSIVAFVKAAHPDCRFEVLYPTDVNSPALNKVINYPVADWTPGTLDCLKTESFTYTFTRNLDLALGTINAGEAWGFPPAKRSHLVGIEDSATAWAKEARMAEAKRFDSVVLFALDQFCLMGYSLPISRGLRRAVQLG